jgi:hypothetical protein
VTGDIEDADGVLKITRINVHYLLRLPDIQQEAAREYFNNYIHKCPAAQGCIEVNHELKIDHIR